MSDKKNVCSSGWNGVHGSTITLENHNGNPVTVNGDPNCTFAFSSPSPGFSVPAKVGSNPGAIQATLQNTPGTYCYCTVGCHDLKEDTNPKTVIIS